MAAPLPAMMLPRELAHDTIALNYKPIAKIHYTFAAGNAPEEQPRRLVVFLNGLMTDKSTWLPVMAGIIRNHRDNGFPSLLAYDRYGQGLTEDRDPLDSGAEKGRGHNVADAVHDLHQLVDQFWTDKIGNSEAGLRLILVANSIGCAIARLFAELYPGRVEALLLLDPMIANSKFDWWPNPDSKDFDPEEIPVDVTVDVLREQRTKFATFFAPDVINKEGLDRRDLAELLPYSDRPVLEAPQGLRPILTVVEHDPEQFAAESLKSMGTPISLTMKYTNPLWHGYNQGLLQITDPHLAVGPVVANNCGHFVQRDDPSFVIDQLSSLLRRLVLQPPRVDV
ncbi:MAG: hypothetical protein L6R36_004718 [Xanthoria steineri]|nr:MAG: hypothetical protein L6R36_004718 [Xanthoria steineri]